MPDAPPVIVPDLALDQQLVEKHPELNEINNLIKEREERSHEIDLKVTLAELREDLQNEIIYDLKNRKQMQPDIIISRDDDTKTRKDLIFDDPQRSRIKQIIQNVESIKDQLKNRIQEK